MKPSALNKNPGIPLVLKQTLAQALLCIVCQLTGQDKYGTIAAKRLLYLVQMCPALAFPLVRRGMDTVPARFALMAQ
ncbi:hypothetical protein D1156_10875 [Neglecta sp. X58]|nr:hypothetical protein [Neglectibacter sp. X58]